MKIKEKKHLKITINLDGEAGKVINALCFIRDVCFLLSKSLKARIEIEKEDFLAKLKR